jgi:hypothetical protein
MYRQQFIRKLYCTFLLQVNVLSQIKIEMGHAFDVTKKVGAGIYLGSCIWQKKNSRKTRTCNENVNKVY